MKRELLQLTIFCIILFFLSSFLGYFYVSVNPSAGEERMLEIAEEFSFIFELTSLELFLVIFANNALVTLVVMFLGVFFGIIPFLFVLFNGFILGILSYFVLEQVGVLPLLLGILPHGIIEIPVAMIAAAFGMLLGLNMIRREKILIKEAFFFYLKVILPLLFVASLIESFLVPHLL